MSRSRASCLSRRLALGLLLAWPGAWPTAQADARFLKGAKTSGTGRALEIILTTVGLILGLATTTQMRVYRSPQTGRAVTAAGFPYALLWTVVIAARAAFSYGQSIGSGPRWPDG